MNYLLVVRPPIGYTEDDLMWAQKAGAYLTNLLNESPDDAYAVLPRGWGIYYLRPGESTDMLDAKADAIRAGEHGDTTTDTA